MANLFQFEQNPHGRSPLCLACEEMLADAVDQTLSPADQAWFDQHISTCADCSTMVADAQRGAAWLDMLKLPRPEPSALLLERIIAQTSEASQASDQIFAPIVIGQPANLPTPTPQRSNVLRFLPHVSKWTNPNFEPRLALTAAMAFFSIALTLNLAGVRLDQIRAANLSPSSLKHTFYEAEAGAVRNYDNLRVVRVVESRVDTLRATDSSATDSSNTDSSNTDHTAPQSAPTTQPQSHPDQKPEPSRQGPTSRSDSPLGRPRYQLTAWKDRHTNSLNGGIA